MLKILGIFRDPKFSNNAIEADRLILQESVDRIETMLGSSVRISWLEEGELQGLTAPAIPYDLVLTMAQSDEALLAIEKLFAGSRVWNSSHAIRNCYRKTMSETLIRLPVNYVPFQTLSTDGSVEPSLDPSEAYWLKRSDFHAIADEDVTLVETSAEAAQKLARFRERGVREVILQKHVRGDIYKFYGVANSFFRAIKVRNLWNSATVPDLAPLQAGAHQAAVALGVNIYGGDAILDSQGNFHLIDLNDWPSFRICRPEAAQAISELAITTLRADLQSATESGTKETAVSGTCL